MTYLDSRLRGRTKNPFQVNPNSCLDQSLEPFKLMWCQMVVFSFNLHEAIFGLRPEEQVGQPSAVPAYILRDMP